jgi:hypothetical protein
LSFVKLVATQLHTGAAACTISPICTSYYFRAISDLNKAVQGAKLIGRVDDGPTKRKHAAIESGNFPRLNVRLHDRYCNCI